MFRNLHRANIEYGEAEVRLGSIAPFWHSASHFGSTPNNGHHQTDRVGPVRANYRHREHTEYSGDQCGQSKCLRRSLRALFWSSR
jgi:hypothetical protein